MPKLTFAAQSRTALPGSQKTPFAGAKDSKAVAPNSELTVSVILRRKNPIDPETLGTHRLTRAQYKEQHGTDPAALKAVLAFAEEFHLSAEPDSNRRTVQLTGTADAMQKAFDVTLNSQTGSDGETYRTREGEIMLPESLQGLVEAVLGLDNRPQARPHFRVHKDASHDAGEIVRPRAAASSYTPVQVAELYGLPTGSKATGQTIALLELGGGYKPADLKTYFEGLGIPEPTVTSVSVDKAKNKPTNANGADGEVLLDIEVAGAVAEGAKIVVYFGPNTDQGFIDVVTTAIHDETNKPTILSISWGGPEDSWTAQSRNALDQACQSAAALGITVLAAAGDSGSSDGESSGNHVDFPASSPHVLACGGTKLVGSGTSIQSEVVWNETASNEGATGGGISTVFPQPTWQSSIAATKKGRGVPDVSGNADPTTGYQVRVDGQNLVIGGTSAVAPLWAGILAVINAQSKASVGFVQPALYAANATSAFRDITSGNNGAFKAAKGWDACTGLGTPNVPNLITLLAQSTATTKPKPKPTKGHQAAD